MTGEMFTAGSDDFIGSADFADSAGSVGAGSTDRSGSSVCRVIPENSAPGDGVLIAYLPLGFPTMTASVDAAIALAHSGAHVLELGVPYSDPVMDGPVIQNASIRALEAGFRIKNVFEAVKTIREDTDIPVLVMSYWNPILQFGVDRFASQLSDAGGAGLITPDLVPDEAQSWFDSSKKHDLDRVFLAAPTSSDLRLKATIAATRGFVYAVSTMGTTGARKDVDAAAQVLVSRLRACGAVRCCVGVGISEADHVRNVIEYADGAIVGSAFVDALARGGISSLIEKAKELSSVFSSHD